ncbi:hypothetical protein QLX08_001155 [Tetragonisca angustula]|uniref:Uncharacterized protein n=1 Tax=Tetragonisca angustula TaxID=166442 RepID=A0AAW1AGB9_9HYME
MTFALMEEKELDDNEKKKLRRRRRRRGGIQRGLFEGKELKDFIDDNLIEESEGQDKSDNKEFDDRLEDDYDLTEEK